MALVLSVTRPIPRWVKFIRIYNSLHERHIRGVGDKMRQRLGTLARLQKFERMRREECPRLNRQRFPSRRSLFARAMIASE